MTGGSGEGWTALGDRRGFPAKKNAFPEADRKGGNESVGQGV